MKKLLYSTALVFLAALCAFVFSFVNVDKFVFYTFFAFIGAFMNMAGNMIFNASLMLALPEENRGTIMGFIQSASVGGSAISAVLYGMLGDVFPLYIVFVVGTIISLVPMLYLCCSPKTKAFILAH